MQTPTQTPRKRSTLTKILIGTVIALVACCGLGTIAAVISPSRPATPTPAAAALAASTPEIGVTLAAPATSGPTDTPAPTSTPEPTNTPAPTDTPIPTPTPWAPVVFEGSGDDVVNITKPDEPVLMTFEHNGRSNFVVESYDADGNRMDLLANVIGKHLGTTLVDALAGEQTSRLAIKADGKWKVIMSNLMEAKRVSTPGEISGTGPDVFIVEPGQVDLIKVSSETNSNVIVYGFSPRGKDLLVNEIGPYTGTVPANRETFLIQVQIEDPWTIEVTSR